MTAARNESYWGQYAQNYDEDAEGHCYFGEPRTALLTFSLRTTVAVVAVHGSIGVTDVDGMGLNGLLNYRFERSRRVGRLETHSAEV